MAMKLIALMLLTRVSLGETRWLNKFDRPVHFECGGNQYLASVQSQHSNTAEDRQWQYTCRNLPTGNSFATGHTWYNKVNVMDGLLAFRCHGNSLITGVKSFHDNGPEDSVFSFRCTDLVATKLESCYFTSFLNTYDHYMNYHVPNNYAIVGFASEHNNKHEDRQWKAEICEFPHYKKHVHGAHKW